MATKKKAKTKAPTKQGKQTAPAKKAGKKQKSPLPGYPIKAHPEYCDIPSGQTLTELQQAISDKLQSMATDVFSGEDTLTLTFQKTAG